MDLPPIIDKLDKEKMVLFPIKPCETKQARSKVSCKQGDIEACILDNKGGYILKNRGKVKMGGSRICDYLFWPNYKSYKSDKSYKKKVAGQGFYLIEVTNLLWEFIDRKETPNNKNSYQEFKQDFSQEMYDKFDKTVQLLDLLNKKELDEANMKNDYTFNNIISNGIHTFVVIVPNQEDAKTQELTNSSSRAYINFKLSITRMLNIQIAHSKNDYLSMINNQAIHFYETLEKQLQEVSHSLTTA